MGLSDYLFNTNNVIENWKYIEGDIESEDLTEIIDKLIETDNMVEVLLENEFDYDYLKLYLILLNSKKLSNLHRSRLDEWIINYFKNLSAKDWENELVNETELIELLLLIKKEKNINLKLELHDAIEHIARDLVDESFIPDRFSDRWVEINEALNPSFKKSIEDKIREIAKEADGDMSGIYLEIYENILFDNTEILNDNRSISNFFTPIVIKNNEKGIDKIISYLNNNNSKFKKYKPEYHLETFKERLRTKLVSEEVGEALHEKFSAIANLLNIKL